MDTQSEGLSVFFFFSNVLRMFIHDLPYRSDETVHVAFPDERYNKPKLITTYRDEFEMLHRCK